MMYVGFDGISRIYEDAKDLNVAKIVVYGKAADGKIYYDAALTKQAEDKVVLDAFLKGMLLIAVDTSGDIEYFEPISVADDGQTVCTVTVTTVETVDTTTVVEWAAKDTSASA